MFVKIKQSIKALAYLAKKCVYTIYGIHRHSGQDAVYSMYRVYIQCILISVACPYSMPLCFGNIHFWITSVCNLTNYWSIN